MTPEELAEYLEPGYEGRGYEFKGPASRLDDLVFARVTRAALSLANRRDGGVIILGVTELPDHSLEATGLSDAELESWNYDDIAAGFAAAADPRLSFDREVVPFDSKRFCVMTIHEFDDIPVICRRDYNHQQQSGDKVVLRNGALYVRGRGKPETIEVPSQTEMREVLELAVDKGVKAFLARAGRVGLLSQLPAQPTAPTDEEAFAAELSEP